MPPGDRGLPAIQRVRFAVEVVRAWVVIDRALRRDGMKGANRLAAAQIDRDRSPSGVDPVAIALRVRRVCDALRLHGCLRRVLVTQALLARRGGWATVRIGARLDGSSMDAHAWLEVAGRPVIGGSADGYRPFSVDVGAIVGS